MSRKIIGMILASFGMLMFMSLYIIVIINQSDFIKYVVTVLGYLSVIIFATGIILFKSVPSKNKK